MFYMPISSFSNYTQTNIFIKNWNVSENILLNRYIAEIYNYFNTRISLYLKEKIDEDNILNNIFLLPNIFNITINFKIILRDSFQEDEIIRDNNIKEFYNLNYYNIILITDNNIVKNDDANLLFESIKKV